MVQMTYSSTCGISSLALLQAASQHLASILPATPSPLTPAWRTGWQPLHALELWDPTPDCRCRAPLAVSVIQ